jgi:nucleotide-binding universal stress UspA family protein
MTTILVPLDGSKLSEAALPVAAWLARDLRSEVVLLTVGETAETSEHATEERAELSQRLDRERPKLSGLPVRERIDTRGDPATAILDAVRDEGIDLIVMSTHGRSAWGEVVDGSIAREIVRAGLVPVTLVRPRSADGGWEARG